MIAPWIWRDGHAGFAGRHASWDLIFAAWRRRMLFRNLRSMPRGSSADYAGEMNYLRDERRVYPRLALEGARSLIVVALNYNSSQPYSTEQAAVRDDDSPRGWISRYAWGDDYHEVLRERLNALVARMHAQWSEPFRRSSLRGYGAGRRARGGKICGAWLAREKYLS